MTQKTNSHPPYLFRKIKEELLPGITTQNIPEGLPESLREYLFMAEGKNEELKKKYEMEIKKENAMWSDFLVLAIACFYLGELEEARKHNETALKMPGVPKFMIWGNIANILQMQNKLQEALEYYDEILKAKPTYFPAMMDKASILCDIGKFEEAIICIDAAIELAPEEPTTHYTKGNILRDSGAFGAAKECFLKAIEIDPKDRAAFINLGNLFFNEKDFEKAISYYDKALAISPDYSDTLLMKAMALIELRKFTEAELFLNKCQRVTSDLGNLAVLKMLKKTIRRRKLFISRGFYFLLIENWKWTWGTILAVLAIVIPILL